MVSVDILQKEEPYQIPGYGGYCPRNPFTCGETIGNMTSKNFRDPGVSHADKLVLAERKKGCEPKPTKSDVDMVSSRLLKRDAKYCHPMLPKYTGFIPREKELIQNRWSVQATQGVASFERDQVNKNAARDQLKKIIDLQGGKRYPESVEERLLLQSKFKLPLVMVRPERAGLVKFTSSDEPYLRPKDYSTSPYFMENKNPQKYFVNGFTGYVPYRHIHFGKTNKVMSNHGLSDFTSGYLYDRKVEYAPVCLPNKKERKTDVDHLIYKKDTALMPTYTGHIPGAKDRVGKTVGYCSKRAHQVIEDRLFKLNYGKC